MPWKWEDAQGWLVRGAHHLGARVVRPSLRAAPIGGRGELFERSTSGDHQVHVGEHACVRAPIHFSDQDHGQLLQMFMRCGAPTTVTKLVALVCIMQQVDVGTHARAVQLV